MRYETFPLTGGVNVATPIIALKPGFALVAQNYELAPVSGYVRTKGFERFDGQTAPSTAIDQIEAQLLRAAIGPVPGAGPVRGVFVLKGSVYAFRDTVDLAAKKLYRSTLLGWQEVTTPLLNPGGKLSVCISNFFGTIGSQAAYGADSVNKPFEFNGTTYTEIETGVPAGIYPTKATEFKNHLFLAYPGGSLQNSSLGNPLLFDAISGAGEIGVGDEISDLIELQGGQLGIFCKDRIQLLQGTSADNFLLQAFSDSGVRPETVQPIFSDIIYLDRQIQRLATTDAFGDFASASLSEPVRPLVDSLLKRNPISFTSKAKNQYVLLDDTGFGLVATFAGNQLSGFTTLSIPKSFFTTFNGELDMDEVIFMGGEDGFVYQWDSGLDFDGEPISSILLLAPIHIKNSFQLRKRFRKVVIETDSRSEISLLVRAEFDYGAVSPSQIANATTRRQGGIFDVSLYDQALYSGELKGHSTAYVAGHGRNIAVYIYNNSIFGQLPHTLESMTIGYDTRGQIR